MAAKIEPLLTVSDLDATPNDNNHYELIEGELFVSCAPSIPHQIIITNLILAFGDHLEAHPLGVVIPGPGVIFSEHDAVIPDLVFITHERRAEIAAGDKVLGAPDLLIEVMSPGIENRQRDEVVKRQLYGKYGVKEYWIVDPENRALEVFRFDRHSLKKTAALTGEDELTMPLLAGFSLIVSHIFKF